MPALLARPPARFWRFSVVELPGVADRTRRREQVLETLTRHGLELLEADYSERLRSTLYVGAAHRIPWHVAAAAVAAVPGYVLESLEGAGS